MRAPNPLGFGGPTPHLPRAASDQTEYILFQKALRRILAFTGRTIDDVVNSPIVKNEVYGYYKLSRQIDRFGEIRELERQWNPVRAR